MSRKNRADQRCDAAKPNSIRATKVMGSTNRSMDMSGGSSELRESQHADQSDMSHSDTTLAVACAAQEHNARPEVPDIIAVYQLKSGSIFQELFASSELARQMRTVFNGCMAWLRLPRDAERGACALSSAWQKIEKPNASSVSFSRRSWIPGD